MPATKQMGTQQIGSRWNGHAAREKKDRHPQREQSAQQEAAQSLAKRLRAAAELNPLQELGPPAPPAAWARPGLAPPELLQAMKPAAARRQAG